ncbi:hypothetical protein WD019_19005 [Fictibacillus sp. Mic-4]|uniref:hypothetical protein n=1 Tax=Fictibacillus sp. Mic-4 TaxID=3132826 RepID=UPI003CF07149
MKKTARYYLDKAQEIKQSSTAFLRELQKEMDNLSKEIEFDEHLTRSGKIAKKSELKDVKGIEALKKFHQRKQQYLSELTKAKKAAEKILKQPIKKPSSEEIEQFEKRFKQLKTELFLTPRADRAEQKLREFVADIKHGYFAEKVRDEFSEVVGTIVSSAGPQAAQFKMRLFDMYEKLQSEFESPEVKEAKEALEYAEYAISENRLFAGDLAVNAAVSTFGAKYGNFIDKTDEFFAMEENQEHRPTDYVDPELEEEKVFSEKLNNVNLMFSNIEKIMADKVAKGEI